MSKGSQRHVPNIRAVLRFTEALANAGTVEQVYEAALNSISETFAPERSFVALVESENEAPVAHPLQPGWVSDVVVTIHAGGSIAGKFVLQYDVPHAFSDPDIALIEVMASLTGFAIERVKALAAKKTKDELVAMAAHELRSPLTALMGAVFLLRSERHEEHGRALEMIDRNVRAGVTLIEELLQVCQFDARKIELHRSTLDLASVLENVIEEVKPIAAASNTLLHSEFQHPLTMDGDSQRLWQIFWNLLTNSVRFASPNGEVEVSAASDSSVLTVCIRDNGAGISQDQLPHIFKPFRQAHIPAAHAYGGLGLGLAIVKDLVALHGGTIAAKSDGPGKGACFTVSFPN